MTQKIFTELYKNPSQINPNDKYIIIEADTILEVIEANNENYKFALYTSNNIDEIEDRRDYLAEKYRSFYANRPDFNN